MRTYAVTWQDKKGSVHAGKLELGPDALTLEGNSVRKTLRYDELAEVHVGRGTDERLQGRPALVLRRGASETLYVSSVGSPGAVVEIAELLAALGAGTAV
jgi:hypothetical protein